MEIGIFSKFLVDGFCMEFILAVSEFKYLYFDVWIECEGWFVCK